jgi:hypothetical protein
LTVPRERPKAISDNEVVSQFLARIKWNCFDEMVASFRLRPQGRARVRTGEQGCSTEGNIINVPEHDFTADMRKTNNE